VAAAEPAAAAAEPALDAALLRVLIAEDNAMNARVARAVLARCGVPAPCIVGDGQLAVDAFRESLQPGAQPWSVCFMDMQARLVIDACSAAVTRPSNADASRCSSSFAPATHQMPRMDGPAATRAIRALEASWAASDASAPPRAVTVESVGDTAELQLEVGSLRVEVTSLQLEVDSLQAEVGSLRLEVRACYAVRAKPYLEAGQRQGRGWAQRVLRMGTTLAGKQARGD
jgi:CheY-like chemotaxis protein